MLRDIINSALKKLLHVMRQWEDEAHTVLDKVDYFRIHDNLKSTYNVIDKLPGGSIHNVGFNVWHTTRFVATKFKLSLCMSDASGGNLDGQVGAKQGCISVIHTCAGQRDVGCIP